LERNARGNGGGENDGAEAETDQHFTKSEAGYFLRGLKFHFLVPFEIIVLVVSERARPPSMFHEVETSTWTREVPRSVAVESFVTVPPGVRVNWVTPFAVGYALSFTTSVAFLQNSEPFAGVARSDWTLPVVVKSANERLRRTSQRS